MCFRGIFYTAVAVASLTNGQIINAATIGAPDETTLTAELQLLTVEGTDLTFDQLLVR